MKEILKDIYQTIKPQNSNEIILRITGIISLIMMIMILNNNLELNKVGQATFTFIIGYLGMFATSKRKEE